MNEKSTPTIETDNKKEDRLNKKLNVAIGAAASLLVLVELGVGIRYSQEMPDPSPEKTIEAVLRHDKNALYNLLGQKYCPPLSDPADISTLTESVILSSDTESRKVAERYNLELADPQHYYDLAPALESATSLSEVTAAVNEFTQSQMGIKIHADAMHEDATLDIVDYRYKMWLFMSTMKDIPTTLLNKLGIKDIVVEPEDNDDANGPAAYHQAIRTVSIDFEQIDSPGMILHEIIGHGTHAVVCDDTNARDEIFAAYNPPNYQYKEDNWSSNQYNQDDHTSNYATKNILEDYAQTTQNYLTGKIHANIKEPKTPLDKKVVLILDRLNKVVPGSAEYLSSRITSFSAFEQGHEFRIAHMQNKKQ